MALIIIIFAIINLAALWNLGLELRRSLMMMQQNSYRIDRFRNWLTTSGDSTSWPRLIGLIVFFLSLVTFSDIRLSMGFVLAFSAGCVIYLSSRKYKKPLVMTKRAWRIFITGVVLSLAIIFVCVVLFAVHNVKSILFVCAETSLALYCLSHLIIIASVWLLTPVEKSITNKYLSEASDILKGMPRLKIVSITGSFGKTSTKHFLKRILDEKYSVTMTPGSFNTPMGVVRTIREYLRPYDQVFIVEMGAKQRGDIKEICDLVNPEYGILTAVGEQHLESFKSLENIRATKFELIDSLPENGLALINDDFPEIAKTKVTNVNAERYSIHDNNSTWRAKDIQYSSKGSLFTVEGPGVKMELQTQLVGEGNISNLLASIAMAYHLGVEEKEIIRAVAAIEPVEHRLSMKRTPGGVLILDDAFNSNPFGSKMALDVLKTIEGNRKIIITPGMIELGEKQHELNREFGHYIAQVADLAIIVGEYNKEAISEGLAEGNMPDEKIMIASTFNDAQTMLAEYIASGDVVLYENDLPDTFK
ncbi:MAG: UDP-N-acetylmuramoyl-tripeptide--D-alanyl-D-alanine ligase [Paramuribaculum sp.]|nr:UDP-N-acetylmuramoyl-tripeptide--D-alanyl-D-alanine ligase [Paramuribaculum sp.]